MSSWFSYIRNSIIREEEPNGQQQESTATNANEAMAPGTSASASTNSNNSNVEELEEEELKQQFRLSTTVPSLSQEQREHIRDVLRRAERSGRGARVVMDSRHLRTVRPGMMPGQTGQQIVPSIQSEIDKENQGGDDEEATTAPEMMIQMDSLPEDVEITVGPYSYCSYASSELMSEDSEMIDRGYTSRDTGELTTEEPEIVEKTDEEGFTQKMQKLTKKIDSWLKSLDKEDDGDLAMPASSSAGNMVEGKTIEGVEMVEKDGENDDGLRHEGKIDDNVAMEPSSTEQPPFRMPTSKSSVLLSYLDTLSQCICALAMEQSATAQANACLSQFANNLVDSILQSIENELYKEFLEILAIKMVECCIVEAIKEVERILQTEEEMEDGNCYTILVEDLKQKTNIDRIKWDRMESLESAQTSGGDTQISTLEPDENTIEEREGKMSAEDRGIEGEKPAHLVYIEEQIAKLAKEEEEAAKEKAEKYSEKEDEEPSSSTTTFSADSQPGTIEPIERMSIENPNYEEEESIFSPNKGTSEETSHQIQNTIEDLEGGDDESSDKTSGADSQPGSMEEEMEEVKSGQMNEGLTQEELEHIERIKRLAEESSFEATLPGIAPSIPEKVKEIEEASSSGQTSSADSVQSSFETEPNQLEGSEFAQINDELAKSSKSLDKRVDEDEVKEMPKRRIEMPNWKRKMLKKMIAEGNIEDIDSIKDKELAIEEEGIKEENVIDEIEAERSPIGEFETERSAIEAIENEKSSKLSFEHIPKRNEIEEENLPKESFNSPLWNTSAAKILPELVVLSLTESGSQMNAREEPQIPCIVPAPEEFAQMEFGNATDELESAAKIIQKGRFDEFGEEKGEKRTENSQTKLEKMPEKSEEKEEKFEEINIPKISPIKVDDDWIRQLVFGDAEKKTEDLPSTTFTGKVEIVKPWEEGTKDDAFTAFAFEEAFEEMKPTVEETTIEEKDQIQKENEPILNETMRPEDEISIEMEEIDQNPIEEIQSAKEDMEEFSAEEKPILEKETTSQIEAMPIEEEKCTSPTEVEQMMTMPIEEFLQKLEEEKVEILTKPTLELTTISEIPPPIECFHSELVFQSKDEESLPSSSSTSGADSQPISFEIEEEIGTEIEQNLEKNSEEMPINIMESLEECTKMQDENVQEGIRMKEWRRSSTSGPDSSMAAIEEKSQQNEEMDFGQSFVEEKLLESQKEEEIEPSYSGKIDENSEERSELFAKGPEWRRLWRQRTLSIAERSDQKKEEGPSRIEKDTEGIKEASLEENSGPISPVELIQENENLEKIPSMPPQIPYSITNEGVERSDEESSGKTSEADSKRCSIEREMEELKDGQELTQEELEHIERIRRLAEESATFEMVQPTNVPMPKDEELTQEELEHIEWIKRLAEESSFEFPITSAPFNQIPIAQEQENTQMAEETNNMPAEFEIVEQLNENTIKSEDDTFKKDEEEDDNIDRRELFSKGTTWRSIVRQRTMSLVANEFEEKLPKEEMKILTEEPKILKELLEENSGADSPSSISSMPEVIEVEESQKIDNEFSEDDQNVFSEPKFDEQKYAKSISPSSTSGGTVIIKEGEGELKDENASIDEEKEEEFMEEFVQKSSSSSSSTSGADSQPASSLLAEEFEQVDVVEEMIKEDQMEKEMPSSISSPTSGADSQPFSFEEAEIAKDHEIETPIKFIDNADNVEEKKAQIMPSMEILPGNVFIQIPPPPKRPPPPPPQIPKQPTSKNEIDPMKKPLMESSIQPPPRPPLPLISEKKAEIKKENVDGIGQIDEGKFIEIPKMKPEILSLEKEAERSDEESSGRTSEADSAPDLIEEEMEELKGGQMNEELTQEELEHIERIRRLAEESASLDIVQLTNLPMLKEVEELTKEELEHIERVKMAEENANFGFAHPNMPMSKQKDELKEVELTQEELDHIERIKRLAEESEFENIIGMPIEKKVISVANLTQISSKEESKITDVHKAYNPFLELIAESNEEFDQEKEEKSPFGKNPFEDEKVAKADRQELFARGKAWKRMVWARTLSLVVEEEQQPSQKDSLKFEAQMPIEEEEQMNEGIEKEARKEAEQIGQIDNLMEKSMGLDILAEQIWPQFEAEEQAGGEEKLPSVLSFILPRPTRNEAAEQTEAKLLSCFGANIFVKEEAADESEPSEPTKEEKMPMEIEEDDWIQRLVTGGGESAKIEATAETNENKVEEEKHGEIENIESRMALFARGQEWRKIARAMTLAEEEEKATDTVEMTEMVPTNDRKKAPSSFIEEEIPKSDEQKYAKSISSSSSSTSGGTVLINEEENELKDENASIDEEKKEEFMEKFAQKSSSSSSSTSGADTQPASSLPAEEFEQVDVVEEAIEQNETQMAKKMPSSSISSQTSGADSPSESEMEEEKDTQIDEFPSAKSSKPSHFVHFKEEEAEDKEKPVDDTASTYFEKESVEECTARRIVATQSPTSSPFLTSFGSTTGSSAISILGSMHAQEEAAFERRHFAKEAMDWHNQMEEKLQKLEERAEKTNLATTESSSSSSEEREDKSPIEEDLSVEFEGIQEEMEGKSGKEMQSNEYFAEEFRREMEEFEAESSSTSSSNEPEKCGEKFGEIVEEVEEKEFEEFEPKLEMAIPSSSISTSIESGGIAKQNIEEFDEEMPKPEQKYAKSSSSSSSTSGGTVQINEEENELKDENALIDEEREEKFMEEFAQKSSSSSSSTSGADSQTASSLPAEEFETTEIVVDGQIAKEIPSSSSYFNNKTEFNKEVEEEYVKDAPSSSSSTSGADSSPPSSSIEEEIIENEATTSLPIQMYPTQNEQLELTKEELEHIERVQKAAEAILYGQSDIVDILPMKIEEKERELRREELVSIQRVQDSSHTIVQQNLQKDIQQGETTMEKAEESKERKENEEIVEMKAKIMEESKLETKESSKTGSADSEDEIEFEREMGEDEYEEVQNVQERIEDEKIDNLEPNLMEESELDKSESSKTESADSDAEINDEFEDKNVEMEATISSRNVVPVINVIPPMPPERPPPPPTKIFAEKSAKEEENANKLTEEELAHIERVLKLAEASGQTPWGKMNERQLELEEGEMAEIIKGQNDYKEVGKIQEVLSRPPSPVESIQEGENLEKMPSIQPQISIPEMEGGDEESSGKTSGADSQPSSIEEEMEEMKGGQILDELTQEELEHIERIKRLAEESVESAPFEMVQPTNVPMPKDEFKEVELTKEELEHIERIKRLADESSFEMTDMLGQMMPKPLPLPPARPSMASRSFTLKDEVPEEKQLKMEAEESNEKEIDEMELTLEELAQIERVQKMAEESGFVPMEWPQISQKHSNLIGMPSENEFEKQEKIEKMPEEWELTEAELAQIEMDEKIDEEIDKIVPLRPTILRSAMPPLPTRPPRPRTFSQGNITKELKFGKEKLEEAKIEREETKKDELTQEELAQIERVQKMAEESGFEPMEWPIMTRMPSMPPAPKRPPPPPPPPITSKVTMKSEESDKTSGADSEPNSSVDTIQEDENAENLKEMSSMPPQMPIPKAERSLDEESSSKTSEADSKHGSVEEEMEELKDGQIEEELTQEELEHIERIRRLAEESSFEMTNLGQIMPKSAALPPSRPPMMFRSLKNEVPEESERESKMETEESKEKEIAEMELTQEELEKNERVKRLAEQSSFENAIGLPIEKNEVPSLPPSKEEANLDKMAQIANLSENEANETDNKIVDSEEVAQPETPLGIPQASRTSFSSLQIDGANFMEGAQQRTRQSSLTTTVSYTNKMRGRRWLSVTDTSIDQHQQVQPSDHSWEEMPEKASSRKASTSSVKIVFTDEKLRKSFCEDADEFAPVEATKEMPKEETKMVDEPIIQDWTANIDFMARLAFMAQRLTEECAEEAVKDIEAIEQIRHNPRALYFDDKYCGLLKEDIGGLMDGEEEEEEEEEVENGLIMGIPSETMLMDKSGFIEPIGNNQEGGDTVQLAEEPTFQVEPLLDEGNAKSSLGQLFSSILGQSRHRRSSTTERPRSALPFLRRTSPAPPSSPQQRKASAGDAVNGIAAVSNASLMNLLRKSSIASDQGGQFRGELAEDGTGPFAIDLPEEALAGLSEAERAHILRVMAESQRQRLPPPPSSVETSRSPSTILPTSSAPHSPAPTVIEGLNEAEKKHIESVLQKATLGRDSPFIIQQKVIEEEIGQKGIEEEEEAKMDELEENTVEKEEEKPIGKSISFGSLFSLQSLSRRLSRVSDKLGELGGTIGQQLAMTAMDGREEEEKKMEEETIGPIEREKEAKILMESNEIEEIGKKMDEKEENEEEVESSKSEETEEADEFEEDEKWEDEEMMEENEADGKEKGQEEWPELTAAELEHIRRVNEMAAAAVSADDFDDFQFGNLKETAKPSPVISVASGIFEKANEFAASATAKTTEKMPIDAASSLSSKFSTGFQTFANQTKKLKQKSGGGLFGDFASKMRSGLGGQTSVLKIVTENAELYAESKPIENMKETVTEGEKKMATNLAENMEGAKLPLGQSAEQLSPTSPEFWAIQGGIGQEETENIEEEQPEKSSGSSEASTTSSTSSGLGESIVNESSLTSLRSEQAGSQHFFSSSSAGSAHSSLSTLAEQSETEMITKPSSRIEQSTAMIGEEGKDEEVDESARRVVDEISWFKQQLESMNRALMMEGEGDGNQAFQTPPCQPVSMLATTTNLGEGGKMDGRQISRPIYSENFLDKEEGSLDMAGDDSNSLHSIGKEDGKWTDLENAGGEDAKGEQQSQNLLKKVTATKTVENDFAIDKTMDNGDGARKKAPKTKRERTSPEAKSNGQEGIDWFVEGTDEEMRTMAQWPQNAAVPSAAEWPAAWRIEAEEGEASKYAGREEIWPWPKEENAQFGITQEEEEREVVAFDGTGICPSIVPQASFTSPLAHRHSSALAQSTALEAAAFVQSPLPPSHHQSAVNRQPEEFVEFASHLPANSSEGEAQNWQQKYYEGEASSRLIGEGNWPSNLGPDLVELPEAQGGKEEEFSAKYLDKEGQKRRASESKISENASIFGLSRPSEMRGRAHSTVAAISQEATNLKTLPEENPAKSSVSSVENTNQPPPRPQPPITPKTTTNPFGGTQKMFGPSKSSSQGIGGFGGMFGSKFGKLASNTLKGAKQAGEQLGQKAASAVEKANQALTESVTPSTSLSASTSTPPRPHSSLGFAGPPTSQQSQQEPRPKSSSLADISLPPGFDQLSEEEQMKIMAVMQCAQLDTELAEAGLISAPQTMVAPPSKAMAVAESPKKSVTSVPIRPTPDEPDLSGLSEAEQRQIREVMRAAEVHEQIERERQGIGRDETAEHNRMVESGGPISVSHEQLSDQAPRRQSTSTGQVPLAQMMDMAKEVTEMVEAEEEEGLLGTGAIVEGSPSLLENLSKYGQPTLPPSSNTEEKMEEDEEQWMQPPRPEFTAPPEHWDNVPVTSAVHQRKLWTTVFTEEASAAAGTKSPEIGQGVTKMRADGEVTKMRANEEEEELPEISAETVRGCWEMGAGKSAQEILASTGRGQRQGIGQLEEEGNEESVATIARHIYSQHFEEQQKAEESGGQMPPQSQQRIGSRMLEEQHSNSYEVEMEDPWSPSFTAKSLADAMIAAASVNGTQPGHQKMPQQPQFPPPTIMVTGEKTPTEEDSEEEEEIIGGGEREDGMARERQSTTTSSSSEEEDDYPDQAPTVSPATIAAMQEQNEMEHDKIAAEVLQQIQAFGEAADDEFDVQWAKQPSPQQPSQTKQQPQQKALPKIAANRDNFFMEDAANVYSPPEGPQNSTAPKSIETASKSAEKPKMPEDKQQNRQQPNGTAAANQQQAILYRQRTNPFLVEEAEDGQPIGGGEEEEDEDEEEEEAGQDVVIRQEHLDAEDGENAATEAERYYKGQFDHSMYFAHRPGPVYTIPENPTEEDKGMAASNREGIYHADRIERKPLHSETVPELIPAEAMAASARRRSRSKSATSSQSSTATTASSQIEQQKQPQRFWAASSAVQGATVPTVAEGAIPSDSSVDEQLTPIRSAPPPPPTEAQMPTAGQIEGTITQSKVGHHPSVNAALHLQQQLQQLNQHKFVNKVKDIAQQEDLPPPSKHVPMLGDDGGDDDLATSSSIQSPRLKRSPAMNLTGLVQSTTVDSGIGIDQYNRSTSAEELAQTSRMVENAQQSASQIHHYQPIATSTTEQQQQKATYPQKPQSSSSLPIAIGASPLDIATFTSSTFGTAILQQFTQSAAEMGRRRLPSLPSSTLPYSSSGHIYSATSVPTITTSATSLPYTSGAIDSSHRHIPPQQPSLASIFGHRTTASTSTAPSQTSPVIYYTSSAPEKKDVAVNGNVPISTPQEWLPEGRVLFDPALVASAQHATLSSRSPPWSARTSTAITTTTMANGHVRPYGSMELPYKSSVLPGATFRPGRTSPAFSRPLSAILPSTAYFPPSTLSTSLSPPRRIQQQERQSRSRTQPPTSTSERATQETLCQLMFKKELRDALAKRKEQLDMCEIEAGHRQYVIDKWMRSGILPQRFLRPAELDAIPAVVKCTLPPELIAGAKIVPSRFAMAHEPPRYGLPSTSSAVSAKLTATTSAATSMPQFYQQQQPRLVRSIGCQATDGPQTQTAFFATQRSWRQPTQTQTAFYQMPSTSLSAQLRAGTTQTTKFGTGQKCCEASTQTALCAETQTDPRIDIDNDYDIRQQQRHWQWPDTTSAALGGATFDHEYYQPLERPSQYQQWEHPEQQQRQSRRRRGRLGRFLATADTTSERGRKERLVRDELERRRRELRYSIPDLTEFDQQTQQFYAQPHASYPQHWSGSLPRGLEFGQQIPPPTAAPHSLPISTFTSPQPRRPPPIGYGYGSLPRDYERRMASTAAATAFSPARSSQFDGRFGAQPPPPPISSYSRSMQDLDRLGAGGRYSNQYGPPLALGRADQQPWPQYPSRSMNYLDRMGPAEAEDYRRAAAANYRPRFAGIADDLATFEQQGPPPADSQELLLSEYANYLNSQFLLDQRQREMAERELMAEMGPPPPLMPAGGYYPPAERPPFQPTSVPYYPSSIESQQQQFGRVAPFPTAPGPSVEQPGVYSRSEANYGARPPPQWTQDYGNLYWRQPPLEGRQPLYGGYSTAQPYNGIWPGERPPPTNWPMPRPPNPPYGTMAYQSPLQQQRMRPNWNYNNSPAAQMMSAGAAASQRLAQQQQRLEATAPQGILRRRAPPLRSTTTADEMWPKEMADYGWRSAREGGHINPRNESSGTSHSLPRRSGEIKRLLLTRRYKHENIFKDLGIRVVGGKKLANGDLGAFITSIDKGRAAQETLGELREGDQVLEWNGVLLSGKTYEEVERIMQAGTGEIELIVCSHRKGGTQKKNIYDGDDEEEEGDAKINGQNGGKLEEEEDIGSRIARITQGCYDEEDGWTADRVAGRGPKRTRQLAFADDSKGRGVGAGQKGLSSAKWGQSPNEPPPIPAHQSSNSISGEEEGGGNGGSGGTGRNLPRHQSRPKRSTSSMERAKAINGRMESELDEHPSIGTNGFGGRTGRLNGSHGYLQLAFAYDQLEQMLRVRIIAARALQMRERGIAPNAFVKIYLMPDKKVSNKRRTKYVPHSANPVWDQQVDYSIGADLLARYSLEFTVYDYRRTENHPLGQCTVNLSDPSIVFSGTARWFALQPSSPLPSNAVEDGGGYGNATVPNGGIAQIEHQRTTTTRFMDYNPATLDILNGYPAIA